MSSSSAVDLDSAEAGVERMELGTSKNTGVSGAPDEDGDDKMPELITSPLASEKDIDLISSIVDGDDDDDAMPELITGRGTAGKDDDDNSSTASDGEAEANGDIMGGKNGDGVASTADADMILLKAASLKELGNAHFGKKELDDAARCYRKGTVNLKKLNKNNQGDVQVKALLVSMQTNLSMVLYKQDKYRMSCDVAGKALEVDPDNVKALYRRAVAYRKTGDYDGAIADLRHAAKLDPKNAAVRKDFVAAKKELEASKKSQRASLQKAFDSKSGSSFLYDDKEAEQKRKAKDKERQKKEKQELEKKRKIEWEDECVKRMSKNEPAVSYDEWDEEQKQKAEAEEELRKEVEAEKTKADREAQEEARKNAPKEESLHDSDSDDDLTESELAMMRGYKKTADGRTTSYFNNELSDDAKQRIGSIAPKRLKEALNTPTPRPAGLKSAQEGESQPSAWNQAGTWEEKDTTTWCTAELQKRLEETTVTMKFDADIVKVDDLTGDASVATAGGKKRYIFEFHSKLNYEIKDPEIKDPVEKVIASGAVRLPDISSTSHEELEITFETWKKAPSQATEANALAARAALADELRASVQRWVNDYNEKY
jgi:tetratricopeptide (TPR) repeat protein